MHGGHNQLIKQNLVLAIGLAALLSTGEAATAHKKEGPLGDLMCRVQAIHKPQASSPLNTQAIACVYQPTKGGIEELYTGTLSTLVPNTMLRGKRVFAWVVRGSSGIDVGPGILSQSYEDEGQTVDGVSPSLVGRSKPSIVLRESRPGQTPIAAMRLELRMTPA